MSCLGAAQQVTASAGAYDAQGAVVSSVALDEMRLTLRGLDVGRGRLMDLEVWRDDGESPRLVALISTSNPYRRHLREGITVVLDDKELMLRKAPGWRWRHLILTGDDIAWTIDRRGGPFRASDADGVLIQFTRAGRAVRYRDTVAHDHRALAIGLQHAGVTETLAWWYRLQFF